jgi:hypothetical protein
MNMAVNELVWPLRQKLNYRRMRDTGRAANALAAAISAPDVSVRIR